MYARRRHCTHILIVGCGVTSSSCRVVVRKDRSSGEREKSEEANGQKKSSVNSKEIKTFNQRIRRREVEESVKPSQINATLFYNLLINPFSLKTIETQ